MTGQQTTWVIYGLRLESSSEIRYVGLAKKDYRRRFQDHLRDARNGVKGGRFDWIRKYGEGSVSVVLEEGVMGDTDYLNYLERYWEDSLRSFGNRLLNAKPCGSGFPAQTGPDNPMYGRHHSEETRSKIRLTREERGLNTRENSYWTGRPLPEDTRQKIREKATGKVLSDETRSKMSLTRSGVRLSSQHSANISKALKGHLVSESTRAKISEARKSNPSPSNHVRWHLRRGLVNPDCSFCRSDDVS